MVKKKFFKEWCLEELKAMKLKIFSSERYRKICMILSVCGQMMKEMTAAAAKSLQSCLTLCDPIDGSPSGSPRIPFNWGDGGIKCEVWVEVLHMDVQLFQHIC